MIKLVYRDFDDDGDIQDYEYTFQSADAALEYVRENIPSIGSYSFDGSIMFIQSSEIIGSMFSELEQYE